MRPYIHLLWCWLVLSLLSASAAEPAESSVEDFAVENWQTDQGLPQNSVTTIFQDAKGYLWMGTFNGLVRFDGVRFVVFDSASNTNLANSRVTSLYQDTTGKIWIGHETGELSCMNQGALARVDLGKNKTGEAIIGISEDLSGDVWLLHADGGLLRVRDRFTLLPLPGVSDASAGNPSLARDRSGNLWMVYRGVAAKVEGGKLMPFHFDDTEGTAYFEKVISSRDGGLWVVGERQVRKWRDGKWETNLGSCPWGEVFVTSMVETHNGRLFVGTLEKGLFIIQPDGQAINVSHTNGLPHDWVRCLTEDREGNLWVGTGGGGLCALRNRKVKMFAPPDDFQGRSELAVTTGNQGEIWVGTEGAGLYRLADGKWTRFDAANGLPNPFVWSVLVDRKGTVWAGTWGDGLFAWNGGRFFHPAGLEQLRSPVTALLEGKGGELWLGTGAGLLRYENGRLESFTEWEGVALPDVRAIVEGKDGTIWFGMMGGGLGRLKGADFKVYRQPDGLASDYILSLYTDAEDTLWIGTLDNGLTRLRHGEFRSITMKQGLPNSAIGHITEDGLGNMWFSSQNGILLANKDLIQLCADGQCETVKFSAYGKRQGLATLSCSGGFQPSAGHTPDGRLWIPTAKGLAVVATASAAKKNTVPPAVVIEEVFVDGEQAEVADALNVQAGKQRLEFDYTALSFSSPEKVRFRYQLTPLDQDWVDAGARRSANYSYVPPGDYEFRVMACNNDGFWSLEGTLLKLHVQPHLWQTRWFQGGSILVAMFGVAGVVHLMNRRRTRHKLERVEREREWERERTRIAQDIHDDLGASLTRISMLSESAAEDIQYPDQVGPCLSQITRTAREMTRVMDEIVWAVDPHHDSFDSLVNYLCRYAHDFLTVAGIRCRLDVPVQLPAWPVRSDLRHNLFLAVKEALNNAAKHARATEAQFVIQVCDDGFEMSISDNGCGFAPQAMAKTEEGAPGHNGLRNMQQRLEQVGGKCLIESTPGKGTRVVFSVTMKPVTDERGGTIAH